MTDIKYSVVTIAWRNAFHAESFARTLTAAIGERSDIELILVVNGADGTDAATSCAATLGADMPRSVIELDHNSGFAGGMNAGVARATGSVVMMVNLDVTFDSEFFSVLDLVSHEPWQFLVPGVAQPDATGNEVQSGVMERTRLLRTRPATNEPEAGANVQAGNGACIVMRKKTVERRAEANGEVFDAELGSFNEDIDLFWWANQEAMTIRYEPSAKISHALAGSFDGKFGFAERPAETQIQVMCNYRVIAWKNCRSVSEWIGWLLGDASYLGQATKAVGTRNGISRYVKSWRASIVKVRQLRARRGHLRLDSSRVAAP